MRTAVRGIGEVMITLGLVLLLFLVYQLWWTTVLAHRAAARNTATIQRSWNPPASPAAVLPELTEPPGIGQGFALMTIPRLGDNMNNEPVLQGVDFDQLAQGVGHYPDTALPGQVGNFAVAAHRITLGEPLRNVDQLQPGDNVYVETENWWYTYRLDRTKLVAPTDVWTINPNPFPEEPLPSDRIITLTTCHPLFGNSQRWIWWGYLVKAQPKSAGAPAKVVNG